MEGYWGPLIRSVTSIDGSIKLSVFFSLLLPSVISKYAKIEPANNSHPLVGKT